MGEFIKRLKNKIQWHLLMWELRNIETYDYKKTEASK